jgi:hypothetical protein
MRWAAVLLAMLLISVLAACDADGGSGGSAAQPSFRNLGKRADSNLGSQRSAPAR